MMHRTRSARIVSALALASLTALTGCWTAQSTFDAHGSAAARISHIDIAGAEILAQEARRRRRLGGGLYFYRVKEGACEMLRKGSYVEEIGRENVFPIKARPIATIYSKLDTEICRTCTARIFPECQERLPDGTLRS